MPASSHTEYEITLKINNVDPAVVEICTEGEPVNLWSKDDLTSVYLYARNSMSGQGQIFAVPNGQMPLLAANWRSASATILTIQGQTVTINVTFTVGESERPCQ